MSQRKQDSRSEVRRAFDEIGAERKPALYNPKLYKKAAANLEDYEYYAVPRTEEVPRIALYLLVANMLIWLVVAALAVLSVPGMPPLWFLLIVVSMAVGMFITLALYYLIWRFYWWFLAISATLTTLSLACGIVAILSSAPYAQRLLDTLNQLFSPLTRG